MGTTTPRRARHRVLRYGLLCGAAIAALGLVNVVFFALNRADVMNSLFLYGIAGPNGGSAAGVTIISDIIALASLGLAFLAGMRAAYYTGKPSAGALTGLIAGTVGSLAQMVIAVIIIAGGTPIRVPRGSLNLSMGTVHNFLVLATLFVGIGGVVTDAALGALAGAIGGWIGSSRPGAAQDEQPLDLPSYAQFLDASSSDQEPTSSGDRK